MMEPFFSTKFQTTELYNGNYVSHLYMENLTRKDRIKFTGSSAPNGRGMSGIRVRYELTFLILDTNQKPRVWKITLKSAVYNESLYIWLVDTQIPNDIDRNNTYGINYVRLITNESSNYMAGRPLNVDVNYFEKMTL